MRSVISVTYVALLALLLTACGDDPAPTATEHPVPAWAKVAPEQLAEAEKHGVPVAFENDLGMRFVLIPAGTFLMGSQEDEEGRVHGGNQPWFPWADETQHAATIVRPFYLQMTEVTNATYRLVRVGHDSRQVDGESLNGDDRPAVWVSWEEAQSFAEHISERDESKSYRLPSEAEWEYACRAGCASAYSFGDTLSADQANIAWSVHNSRAPAGEARPRALPVGSFPANRWGVRDMHGSVLEWCEDECSWYRDAPDLIPFPTEYRVLRGGHWNGTEADARSAARFCMPRAVEGPLVGFRLVSPLPSPGERGR